MGTALLATVGFSELYTPRRSAAPLSDKKFDALFPTKLARWQYLSASGLILPPQDQLSRTLYEQLLTRVYSAADAAAVMLVLAYSSVQEGRLQVHRPEVCYPAAGFRILSNEVKYVPLGQGRMLPARFLVAEREDRRECIIYWTRVGDALPTRWRDQRIAMAKSNLQGYIPDGLLGRASIISMDAAAAWEELVSFINALLDTAPVAGRRLLIGTI
ncbi:EpsI family protein [Sphingomonas sp. MG17]|uniref:EpsI family protein n=2 Tax=Sphingomonas tagetis TaxID=2949092 RepID=A0A9X2HGR0_9SPHN|nr:exosortase-associated protein EpsI, V-type [Sphingomonas tagetis]MCP3730831.1 EpsI family protein [Sphingomonas tagetis]